MLYNMSLVMLQKQYQWLRIILKKIKILTRASKYSILLSSVVSFSFKIASLDRHDISIKIIYI